MAGEQGCRPERLKGELSQDGTLSALEDSLREGKVLDNLLAKARIVEVDRAEEEEKPSAKEPAAKTKAKAKKTEEEKPKAEKHAKAKKPKAEKAKPKKAEGSEKPKAKKPAKKKGK